MPDLNIGFEYDRIYWHKDRKQYDKEKDEKIRDFLYFIHTNDPGKDDFNNRLCSLVEKIKENCQILTDVRGNVRKFTIEEGYLTEYEVDKWGNEEYLRDYMSIENYVKENPIVVICFNSEPIKILWEKSNEYWR